MRISGTFWGAGDGRDTNTHPNPKYKNLGGEISKKGFLTIPVTLLSVLAIVLCLTIMPAMADDWQQFQKDEVNIGWSSADAITGSGPTITWNHTLGEFYAAPIAHGGFVYANNLEGLHKYYYNGTIAPESGWPANAGHGSRYGSPAYGIDGNGNGRIFAYGDSNRVTGVNDSDPNDVWIVTTPTSFRSEITYAVNRTGTKSIYVGDQNNFLCYDVGGTGFVYRWNYTQGGEQFWAGASVIGDYVLFGNESAWVTCLRESDGTYVDSIYIGAGQDQPHIRSSISWNATNATYGHIFFTNCQGFSGGSGYVWKVGFNTTTGLFNDGDVTNSTAIYRATTTPAVYKGRVYAGDYPAFSAGHVYCLHESNLIQIWKQGVGGAVQSSPALAERDGRVYIYVTRNYDAGVVCINDTGSDGVIEWIDPEVGRYSMQGVAIANTTNGTWLFATSQDPTYGKRLAGLWANVTAAPVTKPDLTVTAIDNSTIYNSTYNVIKATVENVGNGSAGQFDVSLKANNDFVENKTVLSLGVDESTTVKFLWTPTATGAYTLNVTADIDNIVNEWDETNNSKTKGVTAQNIPATDLVVSEVCDANVTNNTDNVVFAVIKNDGADASGFNVSLEVGGAEIDKEFVPMLYFRDSQLVALNWTPTSEGDVQLNVTVDDGTNMSQTVTVVPRVTRTVSAGGSIQAEITSAANDTIILVNDGTYNETITIPASKSGIKLIANGSNVVVCNNTNTSDIVTVDGANSYVKGFEIKDGWDGSEYANWPSAGINVTSEWNVIADSYIYNTSGGIKLYGSKNLVRCNTVGNSSAGRACLNLMAISGDCNEIVKNKFDGDTGYGWILGGTFTSSGITRTEAKDNLVRDNNFTVTGVGDWACGNLIFGGDPNLVFNNAINDTSDNVELGRLNWYNVSKAAVENPECGNVVHGPYYGGNFWTAYTGTDSNNDLLGDTAIPYRDYDSHPLIKALCGDVNCKGGITYADVGKLKKRYFDSNYPLASEWAGDVNCKGGITYADVGKLKKRYFDSSYELHCCECGCPC